MEGELSLPAAAPGGGGLVFPGVRLGGRAVKRTGEARSCRELPGISQDTGSAWPYVPVNHSLNDYSPAPH